MHSLRTQICFLLSWCSQHNSQRTQDGWRTGHADKAALALQRVHNTVLVLRVHPRKAVHLHHMRVVIVVISMLQR